MSNYRDITIISESTIKESLELDKNVNNTYIYPIIKTVQDITLQSSIGSVLYDRIRQEIYTDPTLSGHTDTKTLVDYYIKDLLIYEIAAELQVRITYKTRNIGVVQNSDVNANSISIDDIKFLKNYYKNFAEFYKNRLQDYLIDKIDLFPEYRQYRGFADIIANENVWQSPIVLNMDNKYKNYGKPCYNK
jgi:hypothetical protein